MDKPTTSAEVVIIGGGVIGSAAALFLARRGTKVTVLERAEAPVQASVRNAGGVRAQCRNVTERKLAMASIELWQQLSHDTGVDFEYERSGNLRVAITDQTLDALAAEADAEADDDLLTEVWDRSTLRSRAPYLSERFVGAKYCATDGHANPILATWMIVDEARRSGADIVNRATATGIEIDAGHVVAVRGEIKGQEFRIATHQVVHAAGPWTTRLAADIGVQVPLLPARNAMFVTQAVDPLFAEFVSSHERQVYVRQARKGQIHVGGVFTVDDTFDQRVSRDELTHLAEAAKIVPALSDMKVLRSWAGTLDMTPDHFPIIGKPQAIDGYTIAAGFSGHGFCLGPIVGKSISQLVLDGRTELDIAALHPDRFAAVPAP